MVAQVYKIAVNNISCFLTFCATFDYRKPMNFPVSTIINITDICNILTFLQIHRKINWCENNYDLGYTSKRTAWQGVHINIFFR